MCSMHKMYMCVHLDGKIGINYVHMRDWQLSEYAIVLNIAHLILKGRMYTTEENGDIDHVATKIGRTKYTVFPRLERARSISFK